ncbi:MAG: hypothetical protein OXT09_11050, partial [Myxococcales bacterium]|nr:hypothetical protein [Myxococcales bacterium]
MVWCFIVGSAELDLVGRRVTAREVTLVRDDGVRWLAVDTLTLGATVSASQVDLRELELQGVTLELSAGEDGVVRLPAGEGGGKAGLERLTIADAECSFRLGDTRAQLRVARASIVRVAEGHEVELDASAGKLERGGVVQSLERLELRGTMDAQLLAIERLSMAGPGLTLALSTAQVDRPLGTGMRGSLKTSIDLARGGALLESLALEPTLPPLAGTLVAEGQLDWSPGRMSGAGRLELAELRVGEVELGRRVSLTLKRAQGPLTLEGHSELGDGEGTLSVRGQVADGAEHHAELKVGISGVPQHRLRALMGAVPDAAAPVALRVDGNVELSGTLAPLSLTGPLAVRGSEVALSESSGLQGWLQIPTLGLTGDASISRAGFALQEARLELPEGARLGSLRIARASARLDLADGALEELSAEGKDLSLSSNRLAVTLREEGVAVEGELRVARVRMRDLLALAGLDGDQALAHVDGYASGALQLEQAKGGGVSASADLELEQPRALGMDFDSGVLTASLQQRALELEQLSLQRAAGKLELRGRVDAGGARALQLSLTNLPLSGALGLS